MSRGQACHWSPLATCFFRPGAASRARDTVEMSAIQSGELTRGSPERPPPKPSSARGPRVRLDSVTSMPSPCTELPHLVCHFSSRSVPREVPSSRKVLKTRYSAQIRQSRPDPGLDMTSFKEHVTQTFLNGSFLVGKMWTFDGKSGHGTVSAASLEFRKEARELSVPIEFPGQHISRCTSVSRCLRPVQPLLSCAARHR